MHHPRGAEVRAGQECGLLPVQREAVEDPALARAVVLVEAGPDLCAYVRNSFRLSAGSVYRTVQPAFRKLSRTSFPEEGRKEGMPDEPNFATKYSLESSRRDLSDLHSFEPIRPQKFSKLSSRLLVICFTIFQKNSPLF